MASYKLKYILDFQNDLQELYEIYFEYKDYIGGFTKLIGAIDALQLRATGGDEDKLWPLLGTECIINIVVGKSVSEGVVTDDSTLTIFDLIATEDNQIKITVYRNRNYVEFVYQGFIVVEDNHQPFLDPPFTLQVRALDGLGLLKNVDMTTTTGELFQGLLSIEDWLGNILYKTGQTMNLRIYWPFYPVGSSENAPSLQDVFLDAVTFQTSQPTQAGVIDPTVDIFLQQAVDAYTALERIVRNLRCRLFQENGVWNLVSLWSYCDPAGFFFTELTGILTAGVYHMTVVNQLQFQNYNINIGKKEILHLTDNDAELFLKLPTKWVKLNYTYDQSLNKICNEDLTQGAPAPSFDGTISSTIQDKTIQPPITFDTKGFDAFCFTHFDGGLASAGNPFAYPSTAPSANAYIRQVNDLLGFQYDRYLVLEAPSNPNTYVVATRMLIDQGDIIQMSFNWRTYANLSPSLPTMFDVAWIYLYGDDGSFWALRCLADGAIAGNPTEWISVDSNFRRVSSGGSPFVTTPEVTETDQWISVGVNQNLTIGTIQAVKAPVNGRLEILFQFDPNPLGGTEAWFKDIQITILPYLAGSFRALRGDFNYEAFINDVKLTRTEAVEISDSPKRYFKGALVKSDNELIPTAWHRRGFTESFRFQYLMERVMLTNLFPMKQKIEGTVRGVTYVNPQFKVLQSGFLNCYFFIDHPQSPTMKFILTSFDNDIGKGKGRRVFIEIQADQNDDGWAVPDDYIFQYLFQQ